MTHLILSATCSRVVWLCGCYVKCILLSALEFYFARSMQTAVLSQSAERRKKKPFCPFFASMFGIFMMLSHATRSLVGHENTRRWLRYSCNCRGLTDVSFQYNARHVMTMLFNYCSSSSEPWRPKGRQNIVTELITSSSGWVSACKRQCTMAIMT